MGKQQTDWVECIRQIRCKFPKLNAAELIQLMDHVPRTPVEVYLLVGSKVDEVGINEILSMISVCSEENLLIS